MKVYQFYFFFLQIVIFIFITMISLKIIPVKDNILTLLDFVFKISIGLFIIIFFSENKFENLSHKDRIIIIISGFILILLVDYIKVINIIKSWFSYDYNKNNS